jgi:peptide/nickel transport system substrate-binding protein
MRVEPQELSEGTEDRAWVHVPLFNAPLAAWNLQGTPFSVLAEAVPQLNSDTWRVLPDGRMETTYRLRPDLTWHDGAPLTSEDFVFTLQAQRARAEWGIITTPIEIRQIEAVSSPDPRTVVIQWRQPYAEAAAPELLPFPRHILEASLAEGQNAFAGHPYWTTAYVSAGPYRLERWERGTFIEGTAFDRYALGQPRIQRIKLTWNNDPAVSLTRLSAGDADMAVDGAIRFEQASLLKQQWNVQNNEGILLNPTSLRYIQTQARPDYVSPRALLDVRARRAILHAIDRPALAETMIEDRSMVADTIPPPTVSYYSAVERVVQKLPYDPRRSEQLLTELGYTRGADGAFAHPTEGRFRLEVRGVAGGQEEQDTTIVADFLQRAGMDSYLTLLPASQRAVDNKTKGTFPALTTNNATLSRDLGLDKYIRSKIGTPENDWVGSNRSGWSHPEFDRLYDAWTAALDLSQRTQHLVDMVKLLNDEMAALPLYYNFQVVVHTAALRGPQPHTPDGTRYGNVHEWEWR